MALPMVAQEGEAVHRAVFSDPFSYCAHPHLAVTAAGTWLAVFNRAPRRAVVLHPPQDPEYRNVLIRSTDEGRTWSAPAVVPSYAFSGIECAGLTALRDGRVLLNQWQFDWRPAPDGAAPAGFTPARDLMRNLLLSTEIGDFAGSRSGDDLARAFPWARGPGRTFVHFSDDDGLSFRAAAPIDTAPFSGGYGMRGAVELPSGELVLPLSDVPHYRAVFVLRSSDRGETWSAPILAAAGDGHEFEEPTILALHGERLLMLLRDNGTRILHGVSSDDGGRSWSAPRPTGIHAYPGHLVRLADGRLVCAAGRREPPFGIVLHVSEDDGERWSAPIPVREDMPNADLGYPAIAQRRNGALVVLYYGREADGVTTIQQSILDPP